MSGDTWPKFYMDIAPTFDYARIKFQLHILPSFGVTLLLLPYRLPTLGSRPKSIIYSIKF